MYMHTDESAYEAIKNYQELHEFESFNEALDDMHNDWDYLDDENKSACALYMRNLKQLTIKG